LPFGWLALSSALSIHTIVGLPEIVPGADVAQLLVDRLRTLPQSLLDNDIVVIAQKIVSKSEGRLRNLSDAIPGERAYELAQRTGKDPRLVQIVLDESTEVIRAAPGVLITRHRLGLVMANAGVDRSNVPQSTNTGTNSSERVLLLPLDPDASAAALRQRLCAAFELQSLGVIVSDSFGRPWRLGVTNVAIGVSGMPALIDRRGQPDRDGRRLEMTEIAWADAVAAAAGLAMGEAAESTPAVRVRGLNWTCGGGSAQDLLRSRQQDLFR
jgi:coenzyme F420-0:L-glutamate ligase/coenzyme F420-1:gamma-L-glutamate ligase